MPAAAKHDLRPVFDRIAIEPSGCWRWLGFITTNGYGQLTYRGRRHQAHRFLFSIFRRLIIPEGRTLDHLCRNRWCVHPDHLEPVTNHENILRGSVPSANRSVCKNGVHDITQPDAIYTDSEGTERCHACRLESKRRWRERRAAA